MIPCATCGHAQELHSAGRRSAENSPLFLRITCGECCRCGESVIYSPHMSRRIYIWQRDTWPSFSWDAARLLVPVADARREQGGFAQEVAALGFSERLRAELDALAQEVTDTS